MFLLFLIGLGTANLKAQVRIGGNTPPSSAALLDLNVNGDAVPAGNKGLALPRVSLASNTAVLTGATSNITGLLVYNYSGSLPIGIYCWNGAQWVLASLPSTSAADSGLTLIFDGTKWIPELRVPTLMAGSNALVMKSTPTPVTFTLISDSTLILPSGFRAVSYYNLPLPGLQTTDLCQLTTPSYANGFIASWTNGAVTIVSTLSKGFTVNATFRIRCYRPSV